MAILSGKRLGPYEILSAIGAGGMGEVQHRARDTRLNGDCPPSLQFFSIGARGEENDSYRRNQTLGTTRYTYSRFHLALANGEFR
jgi:hypothetical protein